ncbi:helix-turn-helix domain-containing protein [Agrobacterium leguminum]|uniref:winged helix-turn-helix transcriptional regulator n=1 Tax=Agrobacterium leguminum TaxID=2792015 RepID=UPI00272A6650|nr:helix-turn-helix domain-containing protein [Agrobacterium leguminum]WLD96335.1 helix-turn-helix domain-containing protein [Agrobacterium leguminum]
MTRSPRLLPPAGTDLNQPCVVRDVVDRVGDRWSLLVLAHLADEPQRFNALHRAIGDISKQVLSRTVRRLEEDGFVSRTVHAANPPQVEYALTEMGSSFLAPLKTLIGWAEAHQHNIAKARETFRSAHNAGAEWK